MSDLPGRRFERATPVTDWDAIAEAPEFQELLRSRRRFLVPSVAFFCAYFLAFLSLLAWAPDTMAKQVIGSISLALVAGASIVVLTFVMAWLYTRKEAEWSDLSRRVVAGMGGSR
jgi:uncharacterized membrane protein (DUF485 family)